MVPLTMTRRSRRRRCHGPPYRASRIRSRARSGSAGEPTCCAPRTRQRRWRSIRAAPTLAAEERDQARRHGGSSTGGSPPANWPDRGQHPPRATASRWPDTGAERHTHGTMWLFAGGARECVGCEPRLRCKTGIFLHNSGTDRFAGSAPMAEPVSVRLKRGLCTMAPISDAGIRASQEFRDGGRRAREKRRPPDAALAQDSTPAPPRRRISGARRGS